MKYTVSATLLASACLWLQPSLAQSPGANASSDALAEIVVTATKRNERLQDVPVSIMAETGIELEHRGATQLQDIINNPPGLNNPGSGAGNSTNLTIPPLTTRPAFGLNQT